VPHAGLAFPPDTVMAAICAAPAAAPARSRQTAPNRCLEQHRRAPAADELHACADVRSAPAALLHPRKDRSDALTTRIHAQKHSRLLTPPRSPGRSCGTAAWRRRGDGSSPKLPARGSSDNPSEPRCRGVRRWSSPASSSIWCVALKNTQRETPRPAIRTSASSPTPGRRPDSPGALRTARCGDGPASTTGRLSLPCAHAIGRRRALGSQMSSYRYCLLAPRGLQSRWRAGQGGGDGAASVVGPDARPFVRRRHVANCTQQWYLAGSGVDVIRRARPQRFTAAVPGCGRLFG
jgi:hypothetical protein